MLKSAGQVYAVENRWSSVLIYIGLFLNSPILTVMSFIGGFLSSFVGKYSLNRECATFRIYIGTHHILALQVFSFRCLPTTGYSPARGGIEGWWRWSAGGGATAGGQ